MRIIRLLCALLALVPVSEYCIYAQAVNATLLGTITDTSGAVVANAKVTITETRTDVARSGQTNGSGNYTFADIAPGTYSVAVELSGFKKEVRQSVDVAINTSARVDIQLQPGDISQSIEVTATPPQLQTDRADTGSSLSSVAMANLPTSTNRNFQSLLNLVPGTTRSSFSIRNFSMPPVHCRLK